MTGTLKWLAYANGVTMYLHDLQAGGAQQAISVPSDYYSNTHTSFSPDLSYMATATECVGRSGLVIYDLSTFAPIVDPVDLTATVVRDVAWAPAGNTLAALPAAGLVVSLALYDTTTWTQRLLSTPTSQYATNVSYSADGTRLAVGVALSPWVRVYNPADGSLVADAAGVSSISGNVRSVALSPDGSTLAVRLSGAPYLRLLSVPSMTELPVVASPPTSDGTGGAPVFSPDGQWLAVTMNNAPYLALYETATWTRLATPAAVVSAIYSLGFSADNAYLAVGSSGGLLTLDTTDWSSVSLVTPPAGSVSGAAFGSTITPAPVVPPFWTHFVKTVETI